MRKRRKAELAELARLGEVAARLEAEETAAQAQA